MKIIHTSDTHNRLTQEKADFLKSLNADYYFDSGDIIKSGNIDFNIFGEKAWKIYNSVPYDAICPGNREYHFLKCGFWCKNRGFQVPLVSCNYVYKYDKCLTRDLVEFKGVINPPFLENQRFSMVPPFASQGGMHAIDTNISQTQKGENIVTPPTPPYAVGGERFRDTVN